MGQIKQSAEGVALQVTAAARDAGLVVEDTEGNATRRAEVWVYGFDGLLVVVDAVQMSEADRADLVASAAGDTDSIYGGGLSRIATAGNGYQVQLPGAGQAGFSLGDNAVTTVGDGLLVIHNGDNHRVASDLVTARSEQVSS